MDSVSANTRDPFRFSVLVEVEDDDSSISTDSSRCGSSLSFCSWDSRKHADTTNNTHDSSVSRQDDDPLEEFLVNGIRDLAIDSYQGKPRASSFNHTPSQPPPPDHRKFASSFNSGISFGSSCSTTVPSYESPRPASPSLLLRINDHLRPVQLSNPGDLPEPASDIDSQLERHTGATRLERHDDILKRHPDIFDRMAQAPASYPYAQVFSVPVEHEDQPPPYAETAPSQLNTMNSSNNSQLMAASPVRPTSALSRIEDSVEALDILEEEIEALDVQFTRVMTPSQDRPAVDRTPVNVSTPQRGLRRSVSTRDKFQTTGRMKVAPSTPQQKSRRSSSLVLGKAVEGSPATDAEDQTAVKRRSVVVARPTSLLPPKPLAKSTKPLTAPSFELPGVAVGRRLKEQREARLAAQAAAQQPALAPPAPSLPRSKTTKRLVIPNYELPGDAISRRKRQETEERLRKKEEEERKAREFKARPIPASIYGGSSGHQPRENVSSRLRQGKGSSSVSDGSGSVRETSKRASVLPAQGRSTPSSITPDNSVTSTPRGRNLRQKPSTDHISRAASSSTLGQRSNVSVEDAAVQRLRGRDLLNQDREMLRIKEEERKARELAVKMAREEALERSRQASREWAEKQRRRQSRIKA